MGVLLLLARQPICQGFPANDLSGHLERARMLWGLLALKAHQPRALFAGSISADFVGDAIAMLRHFALRQLAVAKMHEYVAIAPIGPDEAIASVGTPENNLAVVSVTQHVESDGPV